MRKWRPEKLIYIPRTHSVEAGFTQKPIHRTKMDYI